MKVCNFDHYFMFLTFSLFFFSSLLPYLITVSLIFYRKIQLFTKMSFLVFRMILYTQGTILLKVLYFCIFALCTLNLYLCHQLQSCSQTMQGSSERETWAHHNWFGDSPWEDTVLWEWRGERNRSNEKIEACKGTSCFFPFRVYATRRFETSVQWKWILYIPSSFSLGMIPLRPGGTRKKM